jgi:hypothetical protein
MPLSQTKDFKQTKISIQLNNNHKNNNSNQAVHHHLKKKHKNISFIIQSAHRQI